MQFDKEINLKIIHALKPIVSKELRGLEAWKELHEQLTAFQNIREIRRISPKMLKMYVMKNLIFDIKRNRFKLPQEDVEILCYPFLATLVNLKLMILDNQRYPTIAPDKLERQRVFIKYLLSRTRFNRDLWNLVHKFAEKHPAEYHYINVNNPQYGLTEKEKAYLRKFACKTTPDKSNDWKIERTANPNKWLEKLQDNPLLDSPAEEPPTPQSDSGKESDPDEANEGEDEQTQIITGLALAEDLVVMNEKGTARAEPSSDEEMETVQLSSGNESEKATFEIPFSFYEDSSDTSDFDDDIIEIIV